jgi:hypothetical protein
MMKNYVRREMLLQAVLQVLHRGSDGRLGRGGGFPGSASYSRC